MELKFKNRIEPCEGGKLLGVVAMSDDSIRLVILKPNGIITSCETTWIHDCVVVDEQENKKKKHRQ